jgi:ADP-ribosylglycohydrolase
MTFSATTATNAIDRTDRFRGALLGLAVGDALGAPIEFRAPGTFEPVTGMRGGGPFGLQPGYWTDDTSLALCLADSLIERAGFDATDQMERYVRWYRTGYLSSTGAFFDIGNTTAAALQRFEAERQPWCGNRDVGSAGNGSLMRLAPVPLFFSALPERAIAMSGESSRTTHASRLCIDACRYYGSLIAGAVRGAAKAELLSGAYDSSSAAWSGMPLDPAIAEIAGGSYVRREPPEIVGSGFVVRSLEAALWAFARSDTFEEGCLLAVNLGDDADTTGAIYGQLAGGYYGVDAIPSDWLDQLAHLERIVDFADRLAAVAPSA